MLMKDEGNDDDDAGNKDDHDDNGIHDMVIVTSKMDKTISHESLPFISFSDVPKFSCPRLKPSPEIPTSVHRLRPADIKVVAALGDSLTAGAYLIRSGS